MVNGTVLRSHAGGYLVHSDELKGMLLCTARGRLKKERKSVVTGDQVQLGEVDAAQGTAVITARLERENLLSKPLIANVDQIVAVQAIHQPEWNPLLCDRYLVHCQLVLSQADLLLCLNKCDLASGEDLALLLKTYQPLGYKMLAVSAITGQGVEDLIDCLAGKISVLIGPSGVGKSSLINYLDPGLNLRVGVIDDDFGRHTTTYSKLYPVRLGTDLSESASWVADTPGFSLAELEHPDPTHVGWQFPEIHALSNECKFSNCLHLVEQGCNVLANLEQISSSRYQSYSTIVTEAQAEKRHRQESSQKIESSVKYVGGKQGKGKAVPRLAERYRELSRKVEKQKLGHLAQQSQEELREQEDIAD